MRSRHKVEIISKEVSRLADLWGVRRDLEIAGRQCALALELDRPSEADLYVVDGLATAALIRYIRCFSSGQREKLSETDLQGLPAEYVEMHNHFKLIRDKHIVHSVSHYEQCYITGEYEVEQDQRKPFDGLYGGSGRVMINANNARALLRLIDEVSYVAVRLWQEEHDRALDAVNALPEEVITLFKERESMTVNPSMVGVSRKASHKK